MGHTDSVQVIPLQGNTISQSTGEVIEEAILQVTHSPIIKTKGKITLPLMSVSVVSVKTPPLHNTNDVYKLSFNTFQLPEGVIPLDIFHKVNQKH